MAVVAGSPGGYHGDGVIDPANTDAGAGHDEQDPSEAHPDTLSFQNPSAALLDYLLLPGLLLHGGIGLAVGASAMACAPPDQRAFPSAAELHRALIITVAAVVSWLYRPMPAVHPLLAAGAAAAASWLYIAAAWRRQPTLAATGTATTAGAETGIQTRSSGQERRVEALTSETELHPGYHYYYHAMIIQAAWRRRCGQREAG